MLRFLSAVALAAVFITPAAAQSPKLTVQQVLDATNGLAQLDAYKDRDKDGKEIVVPYKFSGTTLMTMAINLERGRFVLRNWQAAATALQRQFAGAEKDVPPEKLAQYNVEANAMLNQASDVQMQPIALADLCLEAKAPCAAANPIPPSVLSMIVPIIAK